MFEVSLAVSRPFQADGMKGIYCREPSPALRQETRPQKAELYGITLNRCVEWQKGMLGNPRPGAGRGGGTERLADLRSVLLPPKRLPPAHSTWQSRVWVKTHRTAPAAV